MRGKYLLDTNIVVALFNKDSKVQARLNAAPEVFLPSVALGELHYGASHSGHPKDNARRVDGFAATCVVLAVEAETARRYGQLKGKLRREGQPIPENDLWIAACALQYGLTLATRDRHFDRVEGLPGRIFAMESQPLRDRKRRAEARRDWPVRVFKVGEEPTENLAATTTASERLEMMWPLAKSAWLLAHGEITDYPRGEIPGQVVRRVGRR